MSESKFIDPKTGRALAHTTIREGRIVSYYGIDIVKIGEDGSVTITTGGYHVYIVRKRINTALEFFGIPLRVTRFVTGVATAVCALTDTPGVLHCVKELWGKDAFVAPAGTYQPKIGPLP